MMSPTTTMLSVSMMMSTLRLRLVYCIINWLNHDYTDDNYDDACGGGCDDDGDDGDDGGDDGDGEATTMTMTCTAVVATTVT